MRKVFSWITGAVLSAFMLPAAAWQPQGDISVIVAYKAGSGTDLGARVLVTAAEKYIESPLVISNQPGADGMLGYKELVKAQPDGQTLGFINLPTFTTLALQPGSGFKVSDVIPVCNHVTETAVVAVRADSPHESLKDLIEAAKSGTLTASTNGVNASNHTAAQLLAKSAGFKYKALPCGGTADQLKALLDGKADFTCAKVSDVLSLAKGKDPEIKLLGVFAEERLKSLPGVPTLGELGYYPKWYGSSRGLVLPAGTPPEIVEFYVRAFKNTLTDPAVRAAHEQAGLSLDFKDSEEFGLLIGTMEKFSREEVPEIYKE